jgi:hypothetical protein
LWGQTGGSKENITIVTEPAFRPQIRREREIEGREGERKRDREKDENFKDR